MPDPHRRHSPESVPEEPAAIEEEGADLREVAPRCRFGDCLHKGEPGCAVAAAVESGELAAWRVDSYHRLLESTPDVKSWEIGRKDRARGP